MLLVTYDWPPFADSVGACQRMVYLARYLTDNKHSVSVVAASGVAFEGIGLGDVCSDVAVTYVRSFSQAARNRRVQAHKSSTGSLFGRSLARVLAHMKRAVRHLPLSYSAFDLVSYFSTLRRAILAEKPEGIVISGPPHGLFVLAILARRLIGYRGLIILDYRDGWNSQSAHRRPNRLAAWVERRVELKAVGCADVISHAAPAFPALFHEYFGVALPRSLLVMNGWWRDVSRPPDEISSKRAQSVAQWRIGYFGVATYGQDTYNDHSCIFNVVAWRELAKAGVQLNYYGLLDGNSSLSEWQHVLRVHPPVVPRDAASLMRAMDILLLVHVDASSGREVLAGKIFDYVRAQNPILCVAPADSAMSIFVREHNLGLTVNPGDAVTLREVLLNPERIRAAYIPPSDEFINGLSRQSQYAKIQRVLSERANIADCRL